MILDISILAVSMVLTFLVRNFALRFHIYDQPGKLKIHKKPVPYLGGVAVFLAVLIPALIKNAYELQLFLLAGLFLMLGLYDDIKSAPPKTRFIIETVLSLTAISLGLRLPVNILASVILTYLFIMGAINAVNWMDGMDGLLTGISIIVSIGFYFLASKVGHPWIPKFLLIFISALLGFLIFNFRPAKIFLGDAGSYFIGFTFAYLGITLLRFSFSWTLFLSVLAMLGVFIVDSTIAVLRRLRLKRHPFHGDRSHIYDQIYERAGRYVETVLIMYLMAAIGVIVGIVTFSLDAPWGDMFWFVAVVLVYLTAYFMGFLNAQKERSYEADTTFTA